MKAFLSPPSRIALCSVVLIALEGRAAARIGSKANDFVNEQQETDVPVDVEGDGVGDLDQLRNDTEPLPSSAGAATANNINGGGDENINHSNMYQSGSHGHASYYYSSIQNGGGYRKNPQSKYDDEQTYLDVFGERAKELLTQHIIPSTDADCRWDWRMGRCEPYCACGFHFLLGDYHLGRSCRYRFHPPPSQLRDVEDSAIGDGQSWQEAWKEVWNSQITDDDPSNFLPPLSFPRRDDMHAQSTSSTWDRSSCDFPPESRYTQVIQRVTSHSAAVNDQCKKIKHGASELLNTIVVQNKRYWKKMRRQACEVVKRKVEERAQIRSQPVILTRHGATWIRRVCGAQEGITNSSGAASQIEETMEDDAETKS